jgi:hypothetical protein
MYSTQYHANKWININFNPSIVPHMVSLKLSIAIISLYGLDYLFGGTHKMMLIVFHDGDHASKLTEIRTPQPVHVHVRGILISPLNQRNSELQRFF